MLLSGTQLRLSASFKHRFLRVFWQKPYTLIRVLARDLEGRRAFVRELTGQRRHRCPSCDGLFLSRLIERLTELPALSEDEQVQVLVDICTSICEDPYIVSMHPVELMHAFARCTVQRSMSRRKRVPRTVVHAQFISRWQFGHKRSLGKRWLPTPSNKQVLKSNLKKPMCRGAGRQVSGHNVFMGKRIAEGRARAALDGDKYDHSETLSEGHAAWRRMSEDAKQPALARSRAANALMLPSAVLPALNDLNNVDQDCASSPWVLGSYCRPCSSQHLQNTVEALSPEQGGNLWLRNLADRVLELKDAALPSCTIICDTEILPDIAVAKQRRKNRICWQCTPGLCKQEPGFIQIKQMRGMLTNTVSSFSSLLCGESLFAFVGSQQDIEGSCGLWNNNAFSMFAFLTDEPDKRMGWKTFTKCEVTSEHPIHPMMPFSLEISRSADAFVEVSCYELARELHSKGFSFWRMHKLEYEDDVKQLSRLKVVKASDSKKLQSVKPEKQAVPEPAVPLDDLDLALHAHFGQAKGKLPHVGPDDAASSASDDSQQALLDLQGEDVMDNDVLEDLVEEVISKREANKKRPRKDAMGNAASTSTSGAAGHTRIGNCIYVKDKEVGKITQWKQNVSVICRHHTACKTPAMSLARISSDEVLIQWILDGARMSKAAHIAAGRNLLGAASSS